MMQAKLSSKFQFSIPKAIRENLRLQAGQQFTIVERGHIIELIPTKDLHQARGSLSALRCADSSEYRDREERAAR
jgi:AbrB family looped-hinge helix DNA binding protein